MGDSDVEPGDHHYRGVPAEPIRLRGVFAQSGDLNIELVELMSTDPSAFRGMFPGDGENPVIRGMHAQTVEEARNWDGQQMIVS